MKKDSPRNLPCPCCGAWADYTSGGCACGARFVGEPVLEPAVPQPRLGGAFASLSLALLSLAALWSRPFALVALVAAAVGTRAIRAARRDPLRNGGPRIAWAGTALASLVALVAGGVTIAHVPRMLEARREAQAAATRAEMYHIAGLVLEYRAEYGAYPERLSDLARLEERKVPEARDSWEQKIVYAGYTSGIASAAGALTFNANYELRSPGPDGVANTPDDIVMRDGSIVDATDGTSPAPASLPVSVPVTNRAR